LGAAAHLLGLLGASDLVMDPGNLNVLYAAFWNYGIYKSTDGGATWTQLTNGLPDSNFGRIELAIGTSKRPTG